MDSFVELVTSLSLAQLRIDLFEDAAEGAYRVRDDLQIPEGVYEQVGLSKPTKPSFEELVRLARLRAYATCWYEGERESYGMWRVYGRPHESVAIQTTVGEVRSLLGSSFRIERVRYERMKPGDVSDLSDLFFFKREEYEYECEIRSLQVTPTKTRDEITPRVILANIGPRLESFIDRVIVAPSSRESFFNAVRSILQSAYRAENRTFDISRLQRSTLDEYLVVQNP